MKKIISVIIVALLLVVSCDWLATDEWWFIRIKNNSEQAIYVCGSYILPDTLLPINKPDATIVLANKSNQLLDRIIGDLKFERLERGERLTVFVLSKDTVDKYEWEIIRAKNMILKRYEFNDEELTEMGGEIVYPSEE